MALNPNCPACRDPTGHFCADKLRYNATAFACSAGSTFCVGADYSPTLLRSDNTHLHCPTTCVQCPGWTDGASIMWTTVRAARTEPHLIWSMQTHIRCMPLEPTSRRAVSGVASVDDAVASPAVSRSPFA